MRIVLFAIVFLAAGCERGRLIPTLPSSETSSASDLERLAGRWESTFRDSIGRITMHKVKEINGVTETATWYRPDGTVFRVNRVEFQLETQGQNKVFRYFNGWVVDGPGAGQPFPSGEYFYSVEGDTWMEYGPTGETIVWTRAR
jgi:hypothetical protein